MARFKCRGRGCQFETDSKEDYGTHLKDLPCFFGRNKPAFRDKEFGTRWASVSIDKPITVLERHEGTPRYTKFVQPMRTEKRREFRIGYFDRGQPEPVNYRWPMFGSSTLESVLNEMLNRGYIYFEDGKIKVASR